MPISAIFFDAFQAEQGNLAVPFAGMGIAFQAKIDDEMAFQDGFLGDSFFYAAVDGR